MAQDNPDPAFTALGIDIKISAAEMDLRVNDVPVFDPDPNRAFGTARTIETRIPMTAAFSPGDNIIHVRIKMKPGEADGFTSGLRIDFGYWLKSELNMPFSGHPMAGGFELTIEEDTTGVPVLILSSYAANQPLMTIDRARLVEGTGIPTEWNTYELRTNIAIDVPIANWMASEPLPQNAATRDAVLTELRRAHDGISMGLSGAQAALGPYMERQGAAEGVSASEFATTVMGFLFEAESGFKPLPFNVEDAKLTYFGNGRLATFVPIPIGFKSEETKQQATLYLYYWRDANGKWQLLN